MITNLFRQFLFIFLLIIIILPIATAQSKNVGGKRHVLVYSKNGKGYVHDNIPFAVAAVTKLGQTKGFKVDTTSSADVFTQDKLSKYDVLVFTSTNNDVFDTDAQRLAFRHYIEAGGGLVGIHSIVGTERNWKWFKQLIGGTFSWHAKFQKYTVRIIDKQHPSVQELPVAWQREDECYFEKELYPGIHTFMVQDVSSLQLDEKDAEKVKQNMGSFADYYPAAWHHLFDGGVAWITTLGHDKKDYSDPIFIQHIWQGIEFVMNRTSKKKNYSKAYATHRDDEVRW